MANTHSCVVFSSKHPADMQGHAAGQGERELHLSFANLVCVQGTQHGWIEIPVVAIRHPLTPCNLHLVAQGCSQSKGGDSTSLWASVHIHLMVKNVSYINVSRSRFTHLWHKSTRENGVASGICLTQSVSNCVSLWRLQETQLHMKQQCNFLVENHSSVTSGSL